MEVDYKNLEKQIINKLKTEISINEFKQELFLKKKTNIITNFIKRIIFAIVSLFTVTATIVFAYNKINFKEIDNRNKSYALIENIGSDSIKNATNNGYIKNLNMDYTYSKNIGCKINSFLISDNDLSVVIDFDFSYNNINKNRLLSNVIIYDENKNVYCNYSPIMNFRSVKYQKRFYKSASLSNINEFSGMVSYSNLYETSNQVISQILIQPKNKFPISKKIYINIHDIGYMDGSKYVYINKDIDWNFEIDIPENFYNRTNIEYKLENSLENFQLQNLYITDTHCTVIYSCNDENLKVQLVDENDIVYKHYSSEKIDDNKYINNYCFNKYMITNKLYLKIIGSSGEQKIELKKIENN